MARLQAVVQPVVPDGRATESSIQSSVSFGRIVGRVTRC